MQLTNVGERLAVGRSWRRVGSRRCDGLTDGPVGNRALVGVRASVAREMRKYAGVSSGYTSTYRWAKVEVEPSACG